MTPIENFACMLIMMLAGYMLRLMQDLNKTEDLEKWFL